MPAGILYLIPTPIGNLEDITFRAVRILKEVDLILAEDTRHSAILLKHYGIEKQMFAFHQHNEHQATAGLVNKIKAGENAGLISDAGMPGISDAGFLIVRECLKENVQVICLPGATAFVPALIQSGFPTDEFLFVGFLPQKKGRQSKLKSLSIEMRTIIIYESPNRLLKLLEEIRNYFGEERAISISRELTKMFEETKRGTTTELISYFSSKEVKGEIVVVISAAN